MADTVIENLITKLTFEYDQKAMSRFQDGLKTAVKGLTAVVAASGAAAAGIFAFTSKIAESNDKLGKFSQRVGVDIAALQELGYVAELNGGSVDSMNGSLENLSKITSEAARGVGAGVEVFGMLGLSATDAQGRVKTADAMMMEIADSVSRLGSQAERLEFVQKLGFGADLLLTLQQGSNALRAQRAEAKKYGFVIGKDATQAAADFNDEMTRVGWITKSVTSFLGTKLMKAITPVIQSFLKWYVANKQLLQQGLTDFLKRVVDGISLVFNISVRLWRTIDGLVQIFGGWKVAIGVATAALIALNASALIIPILITAAAAAIFLLIEDIVKFAQGGDSAIGDLAKQIPILGTVLRGLISLVSTIGEGWKLIFAELGTVLRGLIVLISTIGEGWKLIFTEGGNAFEGMVMMIRDALTWIKSLGVAVRNMGMEVINKLITPINKAIQLINKVPGLNFSTISTGVQNVSPVPTSAAGTAPNVSSNKTVNNSSAPNISINIDGGNIADVKKTVTQVLDEQYTSAVTNLGTEVEQ